MKLNPDLEGKKIRLVDSDGDVFEGTVSDYFSPEDNEGTASIALENCPQCPGMWIGFDESDIKLIQIIP